MLVQKVDARLERPRYTSRKGGPVTRLSYFCKPGGQGQGYIDLSSKSCTVHSVQDGGEGVGQELSE